jgi:hypothetical protein
MSEYHDITVQRTETIRAQSDAEAAERAETSIPSCIQRKTHPRTLKMTGVALSQDASIGVVNSRSCRADARTYVSSCVERRSIGREMSTSSVDRHTNVRACRASFGASLSGREEVESGE